MEEDSLPQPYRFLNKLVQQTVADALEAIGQMVISGHTVGKKFQPPKTVPRNSALLESYASNGAACSSFVAAGDTVFGMADGTMQIFSTMMQSFSHQTAPLFPSSPGPITSVSIGTLGSGLPIYAASSSSALTVFCYPPTAIDRKESTIGRFHATFDEEAQMVTVLSVTSAAFEGKPLVSTKISSDASAVLVNTGSEVHVFNLPVLPSKLTDYPPTMEPQAADIVCRPPSWAVDPKQGTVLPLTSFVTPPPSFYNFGYYKEISNSRPLTHTLVVGWGGQNAFTPYALRYYNPDTPNIAELARAEIDKRKSAVAADANAPAAPTGGKPGGKSEKGKDKNAAVQPASAPSSAPVPPVETLYPGFKHRITSQLVCCVSESWGDLVAVGCLDAITLVWSTAHNCVVHHFNEAPHRTEAMPVHIMSTSSVVIHKGTHIIIAYGVPSTPYHSTIVVRSLESGAIVSKLPFLPTARVASPVGQLPMLLFVTGTRCFVSDGMDSGELMLELLADLGAPEFEAGTGLEDMLEHSNAMQTTTTSIEEFTYLTVPPAPGTSGPITVQCISGIRVLNAVYPEIERTLGSCTLEQLNNVLTKVPAAQRGDPNALLDVAAPALSGPMAAFGKKSSQAGTHSQHGGHASRQTSLVGGSVSGTLGRNSKAGHFSGTTSFKKSVTMAGTVGGVSMATEATLTARAPVTLPKNPNANDVVRHVIDAREGSKIHRQQRFGQLMNHLKAATQQQ